MGSTDSDRFWSPKLHLALSYSVLSLCLLSFDLHSQTLFPFLCQIKIAVCLSFLCLYSPFSLCLLLCPSLPLHCVNSPMLTLDKCGVELGLQKKIKIPPPFPFSPLRSFLSPLDLQLRQLIHLLVVVWIPCPPLFVV